MWFFCPLECITMITKKTEGEREREKERERKRERERGGGGLEHYAQTGTMSFPSSGKSIAHIYTFI